MRSSLDEARIIDLSRESTGFLSFRQMRQVKLSSPSRPSRFDPAPPSLAQPSSVPTCLDRSGHSRGLFDRPSSQLLQRTMFVSCTARAPGVNPSQRCEPFCFDCPYQCFLATKTMSSSLVRGEPRTSPLLTSLRVCTTFAIQQISSFNPMSTTFLRYDWLGETLGGARWRSVDLQASAGTHSEQVAEAVGKSVLSNVTASPLPSPPRFPSEFSIYVGSTSSRTQNGC